MIAGSPIDLVIEVDGAVARLARGLLGNMRANRHGYVHKFSEISGCSHRWLRNRLLGTPESDGSGRGSVHLCAYMPCSAP